MGRLDFNQYACGPSILKPKTWWIDIAAMCCLKSKAPENE